MAACCWACWASRCIFSRASAVVLLMAVSCDQQSPSLRRIEARHRTARHTTPHHLQLDEVLAVVLQLFDRLDDVGQGGVLLVLLEAAHQLGLPAAAQFFQG